jgi:cytoskeletal protein RodZ
MLAARRRELGRSLADAEAATRIRARRLEALEKDDWEALPTPAYVRGYIISYAQFLETDPEPLLEAYREQLDIERPAPPPDRPRQRVVAPRETVVASREHAHAIPRRAAIGLVALIAAVALGFWIVGRLVGGTDGERPLPTVPEATSAPESSAEETLPGTTPTNTSPVPAPEPDETTEATPDAFTLEVRVDPTAASWLRITVDGLKAYEGTLAAGESKTWEVAEEATVRVGKVTAVTVLRDGEPVEVPIDEEGIGVVTLTAGE